MGSVVYNINSKKRPLWQLVQQSTEITCYERLKQGLRPND